MSRRGRTRKSGRRTACGKLVQAKAEERADKVRAVVTEARQRVHGLSATQAATHEAGSLLGRLFLAGELGRDKGEATTRLRTGNEFRIVVEDYHWAIGVRGVTSSGDLNRGRGHDGDLVSDAEAAARKWARAKYERCRRVLLSCRAPLAYMVIDAVVMHEREMPGFHDDLRAGLDALAKVLRIERKEAA